MKLIDELASAKPKAVAEMVEGTGCAVAEAEAAYDKSARSHIAAALKVMADRAVNARFSAFLNACAIPEHKRP